jgi:hypothetical protein
VRYFPSWFPGAYYAGVARAWRPVVRKLYDYPLECVQRQRASEHLFPAHFSPHSLQEAGDAAPSFLLSQLEEIDNNASELNYEELKGAAATLFGAELPVILILFKLRANRFNILRRLAVPWLYSCSRWS